MNALELIRKKHAGGDLSAAEIDWLVRGALSGDVPDYQLSALLMAINYEHLSFDETVALTRAFVDSGEVIDLVGATFIDKHSTGGVGDKVSLILLPLLASLGFKVAKMSGRSLGFTGGTIDKLESIPGFLTKLSRDEMLRVVEEVGCCIVEQSADLVPADKLFYALRDATDTVEEMGLIAASVMSKKIACGAPFIVLDVKCGSGAFFKDTTAALQFADLARRIGEQFGRKVGCVISSMEQPLGEAIGTAIEVFEALRFVSPDQWPQDRYPAKLEELATLCGVLAGTSEAISERIRHDDWSGYYSQVFRDGRALRVFKDWIAAQGGDLSGFVEQYSAYFASSAVEVLVPTNGFVQSISSSSLGTTLAQLGAGRSQTAGSIDHKVGMLCHARVGDKVQTGDRLASLYFGDYSGDRDLALRSITAAFSIGSKHLTPRGPVLDKLI